MVDRLVSKTSGDNTPWRFDSSPRHKTIFWFRPDIIHTSVVYITYDVENPDLFTGRISPGARNHCSKLGRAKSCGYKKNTQKSSKK